MSTIRRLSAALALTCVLSVMASAGEISCPGVAPPAQPPLASAAAVAQAAAAGEISCGLQAAAALFQAALSLL